MTAHGHSLLGGVTSTLGRSGGRAEGPRRRRDRARTSFVNGRSSEGTFSKHETGVSRQPPRFDERLHVPEPPATLSKFVVPSSADLPIPAPPGLRTSPSTRASHGSSKPLTAPAQQIRTFIDAITTSAATRRRGPKIGDEVGLSSPSHRPLAPQHAPAARPYPGAADPTKPRASRCATTPPRARPTSTAVPVVLVTAGGRRCRRTDVLGAGELRSPAAAVELHR